MLSPLILATPHPHSTILSSYLMDEAGGGEGALDKINVHIVANCMSL
jgi:hypothetical protein